jgi:hypothetical protein
MCRLQRLRSGEKQAKSGANDTTKSPKFTGRFLCDSNLVAGLFLLVAQPVECRISAILAATVRERRILKNVHPAVAHNPDFRVGVGCSFAGYCNRSR